MPTDDDIARAAACRAQRAEVDGQEPHVQAALAALRDDFGSELPIGTKLRDSETGEFRTVIGGLLEGGGYYVLRDVDGRESLLQPGHIGGMFVVIEE